jgi:exodeoxyribonuclease VII large subunit
VPQRIAVVSAEGAAGYGDFMNQLENNPYGLQFYTKLFPAVMQGERTVPTVIAALDRINEHQELFDCVVIIRGGGATSDLHCFDDYNLAAHVAQFPLPVVVGIGHERDVTVLDDIAAMRVKTPTAAAEWLISRGEAALARIGELSNAVVGSASGYVARANEQLAYYSSTIPLVAQNMIDAANMRLNHYAQTIPVGVQNRIATARTQLMYLFQSMKQAGEQRLLREKMRVQSIADKVEILSPQNTLRRGYTLTMKNGKAVTKAEDLKAGECVITIFADGEVKSIVE